MIQHKRMRSHPIWLPVVLICGCSTVATDGITRPAPLLPRTRLSGDSVVLEIGFVDVPANDSEWSDRLWAQVDEQHLAPAFRREMQANGFRCGVIGAQIPIELRQQIDKYKESPSSLLAELAGQANEFQPRNRRVQLRAGKRSEVVTSGAVPSLVVLVDDGEGIVGKTFHDAQTVFELKSYPLGDGTVRVHLTPQIQYGPVKQEIRGRNGMFQWETGRKRNIFQKLAIESILTPGHTLLITSFDTSRPLGGNFFRNGESDAAQKILMVRLAQSQYDNLFVALEDESTESSSMSPSVRDVESSPPAGLPTELVKKSAGHEAPIATKESSSHRSANTTADGVLGLTTELD